MRFNRARKPGNKKDGLLGRLDESSGAMLASFGHGSYTLRAGFDLHGFAFDIKHSGFLHIGLPHALGMTL
jgi:hypothetical protein